MDFDELFENSGEKVQSIAKYVFIVLAILILIGTGLGALYFIIQMFTQSIGFIVGLVVLLISAAVSLLALYIGVLPLYCIGTIAEDIKTLKIKINSEKGSSTITQKSGAVDHSNYRLNNILSGKKANNTTKDEHWTCKSCGCKNPGDKTKCWSCEAHR